MDTHETRLKRLSFRAWRRGFREADLILGPFVDEHARDLSPADLDDLERLLEELDQDLYEWIIEKVETPPEFDNAIMTKLRAYRDTVYTQAGENG